MGRNREERSPEFDVLQEDAQAKSDTHPEGVGANHNNGFDVMLVGANAFRVQCPHTKSCVCHFQWDSTWSFPVPNGTHIGFPKRREHTSL